MNNSDALLTDLAHALTKLRRITDFTLQQIHDTITEIATTPPMHVSDPNTITILLQIHHDLRETQQEYCGVADHIMRHHIVRRIRTPALLGPLLGDASEDSN